MPQLYHVVQLPLFAFTKVCHRCDDSTLEQPIKNFGKNPCSPDGYRSICKKCSYATTKATREADKELYKEKQRQSTIRTREHRLAYNRANRGRNSARDKAKYHNDPEYRREYAEYQARYVSEHRDKARSWQRAWKAANPQKGTEYTMRYNARKKGATIDEVDYEAILERDGMHCHVCNASIASLKELAFDHVIPLTRNGPHCANNIKPAHRVCNSRKHNKLLSEMTAYQRRGVT